MTKAELLELVANGENSGIEFKDDVLDNRDLAKEIVALRRPPRNRLAGPIAKRRHA